MAGKERLEFIRELITTRQKVAVTELSEHFSVTDETIRRDLEKLERQGVLTRTFGGAVLNLASQRENVHFYRRVSIHQKEKKRIAQIFAEVLREKTTIVADAGSTTLEAIKVLRNHNTVRVFSHSTEVLRELTHTDIEVISTGGLFNKQTLSLQGPLAKENIVKYHVELALLGCKGLSMDEGAMDSTENEAEIKRLMLNQATEVALLVDSSKFNKKAFLHLFDIRKVDYLVTDKKPSNEWIDFCVKNKIQLLYG